jgi:exopolyphosphatase/guanosine-5'-triphosphate,3'-diphosphate pyrophosphatase
MLAAASRLADIGARLHPDHRAELVFDQVLRAPIAGQSHAERAFIAVAAFARYDGGDAFPDAAVVGRLLSPDQLGRARALGAALRLGCHLSGRSPALLARSRLEIEGGAVALEADPAVADMLLGEQTRKRLNTLAAALDLLPIVRGQRAGSVSA